jgi:hypothetical protein
MLLINTIYFINKDSTANLAKLIISSIFKAGMKNTTAEPTPPNNVRIATKAIA